MQNNSSWTSTIYWYVAWKWKTRETYFWLDNIYLQEQFIDVWYQNGKPYENYSWMNNIYLWVGFLSFQYMNYHEFQKGPVNMATI